MKTRRRTRLVVLTLSAGAALLAAMADTPADACSCMMPGPPCQEFWRADAVFTARVHAVEEIDERAEMQAAGDFTVRPWNSRRVRLNVIEAFRGVLDPAVEVYTGSGDADCGFRFQAGASYFLYGRRDAHTGRLVVTICGRSRPLNQAAEDLDYARALRGLTSAGGHITGTVERWDFDQAAGRTTQHQPAAGIRVHVDAAGTSAVAVSDDKGKFEVGGLAVGPYTVSAEAPDGFYSDAYPRAVEILDVRGCAAVSVSVRSDGRISGRLTDATAQGLSGVDLELVAPSRAERTVGLASADQRVRTGPDGLFEFTKVPEGDYLVGINTRRNARYELLYPRILHPGVRAAADATVVHLEAGTRVALSDFILPDDYRIATISGVVLTSGGTPAAGAKVYLIDAATSYSYLSMPATADDLGRFSLGALVGQRYALIAEWTDGDGPAAAVREKADIAIGVVTAAMPALELRLRR